MINQTTCPLCKSELKKVYTTKDFLVTGEKFDIVECSDCRLRLTSPFPDKDVINSYYESDEYISHTDESKGLFNRVYHRARSMMLIRKKNLVESAAVRTEGCLLDIGCGAGHFLNTMRGNGWTVSGVDASPKARALVNNQFGISAVSPDEWLNSHEKYDVITCWHSLEHVHEPWIYLKNIRKRLHDDGVLIVALPNYESTDAEKYGADWAAYDTPRHLYHFSSSSLEKIMFTNEFLIDEIHRMPFDAFYVSILSSRHTGKLSICGIWNGFISWFYALLNKKKCSSLIYVMK